jgi:hypothetical protein
MVAASAANDAVGNAEVNSIAAAAAIVALDSLLICMIYVLNGFLKRSDIAALYLRPGQRRDYYSII